MLEEGVTAVMPAELQSLPSLTGYLAFADGKPPSQVELKPRSYPQRQQSTWELTCSLIKPTIRKRTLLRTVQ